MQTRIPDPDPGFVPQINKIFFSVRIFKTFEFFSVLSLLFCFSIGKTNEVIQNF